MAQELMLQLIRDREVVGYQKKDSTFDGRLIDIFSDNIENWWGAKDGRNPIDHDSFEQGTLVDGEWVFGEFVKINRAMAEWIANAAHECDRCPIDNANCSANMVSLCVCPTVDEIIKHFTPGD